MCLLRHSFYTLDWPNSCGALERKETVKNKDTWCQWQFFQNGTQTLNWCRSIDYAHGNKSITFPNDLCKPIETYIYAGSKHSFTSNPAAKHPKHSIFEVADIREKPADYSSRNNFANSSSFAKVSVPVGTIIPWPKADKKRSCFSNWIKLLCIRIQK